MEGRKEAPGHCRAVDISTEPDVLLGMTTSMGTTTGITTRDLRRAARRFAALSDETRLQIVETLSGGERCVCDLQGSLDAAQSRLSFHLKKLKDAGLVTDRREGRWSYYSLNPEALEAVRAFLKASMPAEHGAECGCAGCC